MFDTYANKVPELNENTINREKAFAAFIAGVMLTTAVLQKSKTQQITAKILEGLMIECKSVAIEHIETLLRKASNDN